MKIKFLSLALIFCASFSLKAQNVAINTTGNVANSSAMLDVESTTKGMLIPRMTAAQKDLIATPATGLLIYQTDGTSGFYFNQGTPAAKSWILLGEVANNAVTADKIANNAVTVGKLPAGATSSTFLRGDGTWATPSTSIADGSITSSKIANSAVSSEKIADNAVTVGKLPAGATSSTFLRGDGTWATPSGGSGNSSSKLLLATFGTGKTFPAVSSAFEDLVFETITTNTTGGTYIGGLFTASEAGHYLISVTLHISTNGTIFPKISTSNGEIQGVSYAANGLTGSLKGAGLATGVVYLQEGQTIKIQAASSSSGAHSISSTSPSRLFIQKL